MTMHIEIAHPLIQLGQAIEHIGELTLEHVDDRVVPQVGVRPVEDEQVGETADADAFVGLRAVTPGLVEVQAATTVNTHRRQEVAGGEAGTVDQYVDFALHAVSGDDTALGDLADRLADHLHLRLHQRRVIVVADQDALAAQRVVRGQLGPQLRVGDLAGDMAQEQLAIGLHQPGQEEEGHPAHLVEQVLPGAVELLRPRPALHQRQLEAAVGTVRLGQHVGRGALEQVQARDFRHDLRHELDGAGSRTDHRHALAGKVDVVAPARRVKTLAGKALQARQARVERTIELATGTDQRPRAEYGAITGGHPPQGGGLVEARLGHFAVAANARSQAVFVDALAHVGEDLRLRRIASAPVGLRLEGKRVQVRRHVAGRAGVIIVTPGTAGFGALLEDQKILLALLAQAHSQAQTGETGTYDQHAQGRLLGSGVMHCYLREPPVLRMTEMLPTPPTTVYGIVGQ